MYNSDITSTSRLVSIVETYGLTLSSSTVTFGASAPSPTAQPVPSNTPTYRPTHVSSDPFGLSSSSFDDQGIVPQSYTCDITKRLYIRVNGAGMNSPQFEWYNPPTGTVDFLFTMSTIVGVRGTVIDYKYDWGVYNISSSMVELPEGVAEGYEGILFGGSSPPSPDYYYYYMSICPTTMGYK